MTRVISIESNGREIHRFNVPDFYKDNEIDDAVVEWVLGHFRIQWDEVDFLPNGEVQKC